MTKEIVKVTPEGAAIAINHLITERDRLLAALKLAQGALNAIPRTRVGKTNTYRIAAVIDAAIAQSTEGGHA